MPCFVLRGYSRRPVKNLRWLRDHAHETAALDLTRNPDGSGKLCARLLNGTRFEADFASWAVLSEWVTRPCLRHCSVTTHVPSLTQPGRILGTSEVVKAGHLVLWSRKPQDAWATIDPGSPFVGLPVATLRERHGQPELQFAERQQIE